MRQFFLTVAGVFFGMILFIGAVLVVLPVMIGLLVATTHQDRAALGQNIVLELDLRTTMADQPELAPFALGAAPSLLDFVRAMEAAERDVRVRGVLIRANETGMSLSHAQEVRDAIRRLRAAGKFVLAHSQGFESTSLTPYVAISAADEVWLQQTATFAAAGMSSETMFLGGLIEKYGAQSQIFQIAEYKTGANSYNESDFTEPHRESLTALLTSLYDQAVEAAAQDRGLTPAEMRTAFDAAPYGAEDAARAGLVDRVGHVIDARNAAEERAGATRFVKLADYLEAMDEPWNDGPTIALITGQGAVVTGESLDQSSLLSGGENIGSDTVAQALIDAAEDDDVKAIVLRIDTPGGSVVASEQIWDAAQRVRAAGKPLVVSMGAVAASGGYYIATPADSIVAQPGTLTGSIGIYGGKIVIDGALDMVGLNIEPLDVGGPFAGAYTAQRPFTPEQEDAMRRLLADGYARFTSHVAEGRKMTQAQVEDIARGRVWSGAQAQQIGLVDELGGFREAIAVARRLAELKEDTSVTLRLYPARPSFFEQIRMLFTGSAEAGEVMAMLRAMAQLAGSAEGRAVIDAAQGTQAEGLSARAMTPRID